MIVDPDVYARQTDQRAVGQGTNVLEDGNPGSSVGIVTNYTSQVLGQYKIKHSCLVVLLSYNLSGASDFYTALLLVPKGIHICKST